MKKYAVFAFIILALLFVSVRPNTSVAMVSSSNEKTSAVLRLAGYTFDPLLETPRLPALLSFGASNPGDTYILQFTGPVEPQWKDYIAAAGGFVGDYIPDYAYTVHLNPVALNEVQNMPFVRWVGAFQPAYKLAADVDPNTTRSYRLKLAPGVSALEAMLSLRSLGLKGRDYGSGIAVELDGEQLNNVARLDAFTWIEPYRLMRTFNDKGGGDIMGGSVAWSSGFTGQGISIAVADTGLDTGIAGTIHQDFAGRVANISSWPVQYANYGYGCYTTNAGANDGAADKDSGHGTHVTGSVAGNGARSSGAYKGLAYQATINFQAVEQWTTWTPECPTQYFPTDYLLTGIPDDVKLLLNEAYGWGARVHNNSWGGGQYGVYDQQAADFDSFIFSHPDMTVVVAAGNDGVDANSNGYVDMNSISSPGSAKNVITVGATDNERTSGGASSYTWGQFWPQGYPSDPTKSDKISNNRNHLAAFSSRGPMNDGRIKPDLVAPGTDVLSVRSSLISSNGWGAFNSYYMYMGGTSMASPLVAGAAALVRDFYIDSQQVSNPSAALIKATLINSAVDISGYGVAGQEAGLPIPNMHEGWGRVNVGAATTAGQRRFVDDKNGLATGQTATYTYNVQSSVKPLKVSLVWSDYQGSTASGVALVNNLNLRVKAPNGTTTYLGNVFSGGWSQTGGSADSVNNVENVYIQAPATGVWTVEVVGQNVGHGPQPFALVVDGNLAAGNVITVSLTGPGTGLLNTSYAFTASTNPDAVTPITYTWLATDQITVVHNNAGKTDVVYFTWNTTGKKTVTVTASNANGESISSRTIQIYDVVPNFPAYLPLIKRDPTPTPTRTPTRTPTVPPPVAILNGNFESGRFVGWQEYSYFGFPLVVHSSNSPLVPHGGSWLAWLAGEPNEDSELYQTVYIGQPYLTYWLYIHSVEPLCNTNTDLGGVKINGDWVDGYYLCKSNNTGGWIRRTINVSSFLGKNVKLTFAAYTDYADNSHMFIDDVSLSASLSSLSAPLEPMENNPFAESPLDFTRPKE